MNKDTANLISISARNLEYQKYIEKGSVPLCLTMGIQSAQDVQTLLKYINKLESELITINQSQLIKNDNLNDTPNDNQREQDIQTLCQAVLNDGILYECNDNGYDRHICIFCYNSVPVDNEHHSGNIKHSLNCPYLIAKDLIIEEY